MSEWEKVCVISGLRDDGSGVVGECHIVDRWHCDLLGDDVAKIHPSNRLFMRADLHILWVSALFRVPAILH